MIPLQDFKKELGDYGKQLSDDQILELENQMYRMCEIAFEAMDKVKGQRHEHG